MIVHHSLRISTGASDRLLSLANIRRGSRTSTTAYEQLLSLAGSAGAPERPRVHSTP
ncbi:hypothetical protein SK128_004157, partial [Halocaridina rubra]